MRVKITLACTECKQRNYNTMKNKKNSPDRLEMNKYCRLESTLIEQQVQEKIERVKRLNLPSVPSFIFNEDTLITGSHSVEYFKQVIQGFEIRQAASSF